MSSNIVIIFITGMKLAVYCFVFFRLVSKYIYFLVIVIVITHELFLLLLPCPVTCFSALPFLSVVLLPRSLTSAVSGILAWWRLPRRWPSCWSSGAEGYSRAPLSLHLPPQIPLVVPPSEQTGKNNWINVCGGVGRVLWGGGCCGGGGGGGCCVRGCVGGYGGGV